jgi:hypothetical protein
MDHGEKAQGRGTEGGEHRDTQQQHSVNEKTKYIGKQELGY